MKSNLLKLLDDLDNANVDASPPIYVVPVHIELSDGKRILFKWVSFVLGLVTTVSSSLVASGIFSASVVQIIGLVATVSTTVNWYIAKTLFNKSFKGV